MRKNCFVCWSLDQPSSSSGSCWRHFHSLVIPNLMKLFGLLYTRRRLKWAGVSRIGWWRSSGMMHLERSHFPENSILYVNRPFAARFSNCSNSLNFEAKISFNTTRQNDLKWRKTCTGLKFDLEHFNGPQTKFICDSLYKHPVCGLKFAKNQPSGSSRQGPCPGGCRRRPGWAGTCSPARHSASWGTQPCPRWTGNKCED